jgi:hypothetical protein
MKGISSCKCCLKPKNNYESQMFIHDFVLVFASNHPRSIQEKNEAMVRNNYLEFDKVMLTI